MHLFIVELGHIGELFLDVFGKALSLEIVERVGPHDPEVDALKKQNIGDALHRATADNGKHAQIVSVVEHGSEVRAELNIGAADGTGYQRHRVGIQGLFGGRRAELEDGLEAFADLGRVKNLASSSGSSFLAGGAATGGAATGTAAAGAAAAGARLCSALW